MSGNAICAIPFHHLCHIDTALDGLQNIKSRSHNYIITFANYLSGRTCGESTSCDSGPCVNGGICIVVLPSGGFECECKTSYVGLVCQHPLLTSESPSNMHFVIGVTYI